MRAIMIDVCLGREQNQAPNARNQKEATWLAQPQFIIFWMGLLLLSEPPLFGQQN